VKRKLRPWVIPTLFLLILLIIPSAYAFYFSDYESSLTSKFLVNSNLDDSYVRATVLTYWVDITSCTLESDLTTCDISGKSAWNLKSEVINTDWILLDDGFYYYKNSINGSLVTEDNIKTSSIALIDPELSLSDLTDDVLLGTDVVPQYEVIYEFIINEAVEDAWSVSYESGAPVLINN